MNVTPCPSRGVPSANNNNNGQAVGGGVDKPPRKLSPIAPHGPEEGKGPRTKNFLANGSLVVQELLGRGSFGEAWLAKVNRRAGGNGSCSRTTSPSSRGSNNNNDAAAADSLSHFPDQVVVKITSNERYTGYALKEMDLMRRIQHPNIVAFVDCWREAASGTYGGHVCIAMEFCNGGDMENLLSTQCHKIRGHFANEVVVQLALQLVSAVAACHAQRILHRDIKPANMFLTKRSDSSKTLLVLGDFGVGRSLASSMELASTRVGTPYYMCPELVQGRNYCSKSDIWAIGVALFELLTLSRPFEIPPEPPRSHKHEKKSKNSLDGLYHGIKHDDPTADLAQLVDEYDPWLLNLCAACLSKRPEARPSAYEILTSFDPEINALVSEHEIAVPEARGVRSPSPLSLRRGASPGVGADGTEVEVTGSPGQQEPMSLTEAAMNGGAGVLLQQRQELAEQAAAKRQELKEKKQRLQEKQASLKEHEAAAAQTPL